MKYIKLIRCKHYIKNILIFLPLFFSNNLTNVDMLITTLLGFVSFSLLSSVVYVFNDIIDADRDKENPVKCNRPIASGEITKQRGSIILIILLVLSMCINIFILKLNLIGYMLVFLYLFINILYSLRLKHIPIVDVSILTLGFLLRLLFGANIANIEVSNLLYLTVLAISFYMGLGKRRNEYIKLGDKAREVLSQYNKKFLDKNMYMCLTIGIIFYSLWCMEMSGKINSFIDIIWTVPLVIIIFMKYSLNIEKDSYGDPVEVILSDKTLVFLIGLFALLITAILYTSTMVLL